MSDDGKKTLGLLGGPRSGNVKQSFSHGRTKNVLVETKRKRVVVPKPGAAKPVAPGAVRGGDPARRPAGISDAEMDRRLKAVQAAKARETEDKARRVKEELTRETERNQRREENEAKELELREREERAKAKVELEAAKAREDEAAAMRAAAPQPTPEERAAKSGVLRNKVAADAAPRREEPARPNRNKGREDNRRSGKLTVNQASTGGDGRHRSMASMKRKQERARQKAMGGAVEREKVVRDVQVPDGIMVQELANRMAERVADVVKSLMQMGMMVTQNQTIDQDTAELIVEEFGHKMVRVSDADVEDVIDQVIDKPEDLTQRAPIITVMGHVDHGKTSLLDYIRKSTVASHEAGGITQHIGAYHVDTDHGMVSFLDTPGHAAFSAMRSRGAKATDVIVLVVAGDDGVKPQTAEAVQHAKAAGVPLVVAINKMDKEGADPDRVKNELAAMEVIPDDWGGDTQFIPVSAHTGDGVDKLLEAILLQAELMELTAYTDVPGQGVVVESRLDKGRGAVASVLVQNGTLRTGDIVLVGKEYGRVRALVDENGVNIKSAGPSIPVEILGLTGVPDAGDEFVVLADEKKAKEVAEFRRTRLKDSVQAMQQAALIDNMFAGIGKPNLSIFNIILKTDVRGTLEALTASLVAMNTDEVQVKIVSSGVGGISENDVHLAATSKAMIVGFNVRADKTSKEIIDNEGLQLRYYNVIYNVLDDVKAIMGGMLSPEIREEILGVAEVRDVFTSPKFGQIAGSMVIEGTIHRNKPIRVLRDDVVIYEGELESLRRFKDDANEVKNGVECGIGVKNYTDVRVGDKIEVYKTTEIARTL